METTQITPEASPDLDEALIPLFRDEIRARKLRQLRLDGNFSDLVLTLLFENCLNLDELRFWDCPALRDEHLIDWANRGAKPKLLHLYNCENVGDEGLISFLIKGGERLREFRIRRCPKITAATWQTLIDRCPRLSVCSGGKTYGLKDLASEKLFKQKAAYYF